MSVDAKCYECVAGAGLEPILSPSFSGGRGQASGFIMRMMAENKKKHQGQYRNPSNNDYGSTMNQFRAFDYKRLANEDQNGNNQSEYGASPFIQKHFGSPEAVQFIPKAQRGSEEHRVIEGETEEQKAARLQAKAEQLAELARQLLEKSSAKGKIKGFIKGKIAVKKAKELLQQKKKEKAEEDERKAKELSKEQLIKAAEENAKVLEAEWKADENAIFDYLSYANKGTDSYFLKSKLRDLWEKWCKEKQYEKFGEDALRPILSGYYYGREEIKKKIIPRPDSYYLPRNRGYNYKKVSYAEAKRVYDKYFPPEEQAPEEKTKRQLALKGVVRRLVRTKKSEKELVGSAPTPKWWNAYWCMEDYAKHKAYSNMGTLFQNKKWFGDWAYTMGHNPVSKWTIPEAEIVEIPPESKGKSKKAEEQNAARNNAIRASNAQWKTAQEAIVRITTTYYEWVFKKALPLFGWKLIEYHPRVEDFPNEVVLKTENRGTDSAPRFYYKRVGEYPSHLLMSITGTESPRYGYDGTRPLPAMKPIPADLKLVLCVEPDGKVAWLITTYNSSGFEEGKLDWKELAQNSIGIGPKAYLTRSDGSLSFRSLFIKEGAHWKHALIQQSEGYEYASYGGEQVKERHTYIPVKLPNGREHKWESSFNSRQIQDIIDPLVRGISERGEWDGKPLTQTELVGSGRRKRC